MRRPGTASARAADGGPGARLVDVGLRSLATRGFVELPQPWQRRILHALGRRAPWEPGFDHRAPEIPAGMVAGPPDFVGIGVQKAGTTWWFAVIESHPGVYTHPGYHKERHYFGRFWREDFTDEHVSGYHRWFPRPPGAVTGCWTPDYLHQHWVAPLLHTAAPGARLLALVRDPVERYVSGLTHDLSRGGSGPALATMAFDRGLYADALERYARLFGDGHLLVLQYEACRADPRPAIEATFAFLGLEPGCPVAVADVVNPTRGPKVTLDERQRRELVARYHDDVLAVAERYPHVDLGLWPNFRHLA